MAIPVWPATVPHNHIGGSHTVESPQQEPYVTPMESGHERVRLRGTSVVKRVSETLLLTEAQYQTFQQFWTNDLNRGTSRFTKRMRTAIGGADRTVQFVGATHTSNHSAGMWRVSYDLWVFV